ncbi:AcrR family transcriptional regulator [Alkalihalobacillus xiaoxiensis]|uniref:AcrR family transcriptional regulator n=1 Tax=Shouchella xiaoxiensis TaxID=766895 RepID=A0ABS2SNR4_9BACI|nr:TetR/AcrR family transcriptional regulator [Shouchella xiaoxiensis]MBM7836791.1 AcrR family transcriptional regulator [Shouchella xiaoxiensis]
MTDDRLREQKKLQTKQTLAESAFYLAKDKGVEGFIVEDVVKKAGFSRRTFANYFSCKEEAIASAFYIGDSPLDFRVTIETEKINPVDAIHLFIKHSFSLEKLNRLYDLMYMSKENPTLRLYVNGTLHEVQTFAKEGLNEAYGATYSKLYFHMLLGAVFGALLPLFEEEMVIELPLAELKTKKDHPFFDYVDQIFEQLRKGF